VSLWILDLGGSERSVKGPVVVKDERSTWGTEAYFDLQEVFRGTVYFLEGLLTGIWHRLHLDGGGVEDVRVTQEGTGSWELYDEGRIPT
jgi:hypothetical protein